MRSTLPRVRRGLALTAAAGLTLGVAAGPAAAQGYEGPPPRIPGITADSTLETFPYERRQGCMQGNPGGGIIEEKPWAQLVLGYEQAHVQGLTGGGYTAAVIDTGVNQHPWLGGGVAAGENSVPEGGATTDCDGHGTAVAGLIAGQPTNDEVGFVGIAPDASILSIRQQSNLYVSDTDQTIGNTQTMAEAINSAVDANVGVINISQSSCQPMEQASNPGEQYNQMLHNAVKRAYDAGIVVVAAAGNVSEACKKNSPGSPSTAVLPAWFDEYVLTVASVNQAGAPSEFTVPGPWVDVAAPGENITSLDPGRGGNGLATQISSGPDGQMTPIQGTSFAAPYVSGLVLLIKQKFQEQGRQLTAEQIMHRITSTALHPGGTGGRNDIVGYGMVDPMAALSDVVPAEWGKAPAPPGPTELSADVLPQKDWPALIISIGGAGAGVAAIVFTAFLTNAVRNVRARTRGD
ncbi:type VII secretion-associated serine protease mycosin [Saccharopolyspora sp. CA-218241]|uniref:type VII secretion-associated serine protease mycosin n=1 Tax=Saccharopolyspora sp. CA-218241 TaxID=3240027 RepID=UPI003D9620F8